jgi:hypothetical protein
MSERLCAVLAYVDEGHCHGRTSFVSCIHVKGAFLLCNPPKSPLCLRYEVTKGLSHDCLISGLYTSADAACRCIYHRFVDACNDVLVILRGYDNCEAITGQHVRVVSYIS